MNKIIVGHGTRKKLEEIFGVSHVTVRRALNGTLDGKLSEDKAKRIRKAAKENGGYEVQIVKNEKTKAL